MDINWNDLLREQWEWHWTHQLRPRLDGLTDDEYRWEPTPGAWNVHPRSSPDQPGAGDFTIDFAFPQPEPAPLTTIAWRLGHVIVGVLAMRNAAHFDAPPADYVSWEYAGTADAALTQLDEQVATWLDGVRRLSDADLLAPVGDREPAHPDAPMAGLVLHINRELIHHGSEIALLRDLHLHTRGTGA